MKDFFRDLEARHRPEQNVLDGQAAKARAAAKAGAFLPSRLYNDRQLEAMSSAFGSDIYDHAEQTMKPWDSLSVPQSQAWHAWADEMGRKPEDPMPKRVRVWRFVEGAGHRIINHLPAPHRSLTYSTAEPTGRTAKDAPTTPATPDPITGRNPGEDYHTR